MADGGESGVAPLEGLVEEVAPVAEEKKKDKKKKDKKDKVSVDRCAIAVLSCLSTYRPPRAVCLCIQSYLASAARRVRICFDLIHNFSYTCTEVGRRKQQQLERR